MSSRVAVNARVAALASWTATWSAGRVRSSARSAARVVASEARYFVTAVHTLPAHASRSEAVEVVVLSLLLEPQPVTAKAVPATAAIAIARYRRDVPFLRISRPS